MSAFEATRSAFGGVAAPDDAHSAEPTTFEQRTTLVYAGALVFWIVTRWLVLVHQGAWPWMNAFVVAAARGIVVGDWNDAVRPQLPAVLGVPLVLAGATEQQMVAALYLVASVVQFAAFIVLLRTVFPAQLQAQTLALLVFLLIPFNHSIHHYRDMPVVLASAAIFLLAAHFIHATWATPASAATATLASAATATPASAATNAASPPAFRSVPARLASPPPARSFQWLKRNFQASRGASHGRHADVTVSPTSVTRRHADVTKWSEASREASRGTEEGVTRRHAALATWPTVADSLKIGLVMLLGIWSRIEFLAFVGVLAVLALVVLRRRALPVVILYTSAAAVITGSLLVVYRLEDVNLSQAWFYTAHTFLDSTPDSWLSPECQASPTENCREADGLAYFGPADLRAGVLALAFNHPFTTLVKSVRSAWDNAWMLFGPNLSTFPGVVLFVVLVSALVPAARRLYARQPAAVWITVIAVIAESVLPPLTWAPPHGQYHVALVLPVVLLLVPLLIALMRMPRGRLVAFAFLVANAALSAFRYTRYAGY